eukprot:PITA_10489
MKDLGELHYCLGLEVWGESGYSDSDWTRNLDDRKSATVYVFNIGSGPISLSSKKQPTICLSSTEAEYKALCSATCEAIRLRKILDVELAGYSDSDWAGNLDDRKSATVYVFNIGSGPISLSSKKQPTICLSSTEAEYKALCSATCEAIRLRKILENFGETQQAPIVIRGDN